MDKDLESIQEARSLLQAAHDAWLKFENFTEEQVERVLLEISKAGIANAEPLARLAVEETGYGNVEHKTLKNLFCADDVYRAIRPMKTVGIVSEDQEKKVFEVASPIGVIAAIIPSTNPTSTTIYKALIALKGRNAVVFSPHPSAAKCIGETSRLLAVAAEQAGGPKSVISCMKVPTMEGTQELMKNDRTALILATGGTGLVKAAYSAGKPAFGVGPGNVPSYVEKTADLTKAVRDILTGKCFDNGTLCSSEQAIICDEAVKDTVLQELQKQGAHVCSYQEKAQLERTIQRTRRTLNTKIVRKAATKIAEMAAVSVSAGTRARVAQAVPDVAAGPPPRAVTATATVAGKRATIEHVVDQWLGGRAPIAPPLSSYTELEPPQPKVEKKEIKPVGFVCEDDVRSAILTNSKITIGKKTIVTPSARDLGEANDTFVLGD